MSYTDITTSLGFAFQDTFSVNGAFIGNYYPSISIDTLNKRWYVKISGTYYKLVTWHFFSATGGTTDIFFWILNSTGEANFLGRTLTYTNGDLTFAEAPTASEYIPPDSVLSGTVTFGISSSDYNLITSGNETHLYSLPPPDIIPRPLVYPTMMTFTVDSNSNSAQFSSVNIRLNGPGGGDFGFIPTSNYYRYSVTGLTPSCNYTSYAYGIASDGISSTQVFFRSIYTGSTPSIVQNLNGTIIGLNVVLDWNTPDSDGGAPLLGYMIRDLVQLSNYNVPPFISTYTAPLLTPGSNLFSLEAVNDPGYSSRVYWSTIIV
jgi:hypothetical protein